MISLVLAFATWVVAAGPNKAAIHRTAVTLEGKVPHRHRTEQILSPFPSQLWHNTESFLHELSHHFIDRVHHVMIWSRPSLVTYEKVPHRDLNSSRPRIHCKNSNFSSSSCCTAVIAFPFDIASLKVIFVWHLHNYFSNYIANCTRSFFRNSSFFLVKETQFNYRVKAWNNGYVKRYFCKFL